MMASVPFCAPSTPPETGASRKATRCFRSKSSAQRAVSALTVEQSMTRVPGASPGARPSTTARTSPSAETQITTTSRPAANSFREAGAGTPSSAPSAVALAPLRFQSAASSCALWRFLAMGAPMAPRPAKPTRNIGQLSGASAGLSGASATKENAAPSMKDGGGVRDDCRSESALRAADGFDLLRGFDADSGEFGVRQVRALATRFVAVEPARVDGLRVVGARLLATIGARGFEILRDVRGDARVVLRGRDALVARGELRTLGGLLLRVRASGGFGRTLGAGADTHGAGNRLVRVHGHATLVDVLVNVARLRDGAGKDGGNQGQDC